MCAALGRRVPDFSRPSAARSRNMYAIKAKHGKTTEWRLRGALVARGVRGWIMNVGDLIGSPDFYFPELRLAVFVDGCFWHGCPNCGHIPKSNRGYWSQKLARNRTRDRRIRRLLQRQGIRVLRFWECELRGSLSACTGRLTKILAKSWPLPSQ